MKVQCLCLSRCNNGARGKRLSPSVERCANGGPTVSLLHDLSRTDAVFRSPFLHGRPSLARHWRAHAAERSSAKRLRHGRGRSYIESRNSTNAEKASWRKAGACVLRSRPSRAWVSGSRTGETRRQPFPQSTWTAASGNSERPGYLMFRPSWICGELGNLFSETTYEKSGNLIKIYRLLLENHDPATQALLNHCLFVSIDGLTTSVTPWRRTSSEGR
jgi:hypothetical protein